MSSRPSNVFVTTAILAAGCAAAALAAEAPAPKPAAAPMTSAAAPAGPPGKAEVPETEFDAGDVERGTPATHTFVIKNVGEHPLTVDAHPGCGCTVVDYDKVIKPGGTGKVSASINTVTFKGPISKAVDLAFNDPALPTVKLHLSANVTVPLDVLPSENVIFSGRYDALKAQELTLVASDGKPFDILSAKAADPTFSVKVAATPESSGPPPSPKPSTVGSGSSRYKLIITPPAQPKVGRVVTQVDVVSTHPKVPSLAIKISGNVTGDISFAPQTVMLMGGASATAEQKQAKVTVAKPAGDALEILGVTASNPGLKPSFRMTKEGREAEITVKYDGPALTSALNATVIVKTNDARQSAVEIPVWGRTDKAPEAAGAGNHPAKGATRITPSLPKKDP